MGFLSNKKRPSGKNSGNGSTGGWTLTGTAGGATKKNPKLGSMRKEWTAPRKGDVAFRAKKRP